MLHPRTASYAAYLVISGIWPAPGHFKAGSTANTFVVQVEGPSRWAEAGWPVCGRRNTCYPGWAGPCTSCPAHWSHHALTCKTKCLNSRGHPEIECAGDPGTFSKRKIVFFGNILDLAPSMQNWHSTMIRRSGYMKKGVLRMKREVNIILPSLSTQNVYLAL